MQAKKDDRSDRKKDVMAIHDTMDALSGKWKIYIFSTICHYKKRRFSEIVSDLKGISNKILAKELKEMEANRLVSRVVIDSFPVMVQYELTAHGKTLKMILDNLAGWGDSHQKETAGH